jgi:hypothetical protein
LSTLRLLNRDAILAAVDITVEKVDVPEWGGVVYVKALSGTDRERYLDSIHVTKGRGKHATREVVLQQASAKLAVLAICDEQGTRLFTDADVEALGKKSAKALQRVVDAAAKLNGLSDDEEAALGNGSGTGPTAGSSSASPSL